MTNPRSAYRANAARGAVAALLIAASMTVVAPSASADDPFRLTVAYKADISPFDSNVYKSVKVVCPAGKKIIGGSFILDGAPGEIVLDDFIPYSSFSESGLIVGAGEIVGPGESSDGTTERWSVQATAVCAFPPPGYSILPRTSGVSSITGNNIDSPCPPTRQVLGGGASLSQGFGQVSIKHVTINSQNVQARAVEEVDGFSGNWSVTAYAICADPVANWRVVTHTSPEDLDVAITEAAFCPRTQLVIGSLWTIQTHQGANDGTDRYVTRTHLSISPDPGVTVNVVATGQFADEVWRLQATAVCADGNVVPTV